MKDMKDKNLIIKFVQEEQKFIIYNNNNLIGIFSIIGIVKYITTDISKNFLKYTEYEQTIDFIEKNFCKLNSNGEITLVSYLESPIMGNIEIMMKIYAELIKIEGNIIQYEINKIENNDEKKNITNRIKELFYLILNHSLKLIVNISDAIKKDETKKSLKISLVKYSVYITNKINSIVYEKINDIKNDYKLLELEINQLNKIKSHNDKKIIAFELQINEQNTKIDKIINYIEIDDMDDLMDLNIDEEIKSNSNNNSSNNSNSNSNSNSNNNSNSSSEKNNGDFFNDSDNNYSENNSNKISIDYLTPTK